VFFATGMYISSTYLVPAQEAAARRAEAAAPEPAPLAEPEPEQAEETPIPDAEPTAAASEEAAEPEAAKEPAAAASAEPGPPPVWTIQPGGSLRFSVGNGGDTISGSFAQWGGSIAFDPDNPASADIKIDVDLASASVGDGTQDGMLKGAEYFATDRFATATFRASSARKTGANSYTAQGTLSLKGVSKPQSISFRLTGSGMKRHVEGTASIARAPFDLGMGSTGGELDSNVAVSFSFDATGKAP